MVSAAVAATRKFQFRLFGFGSRSLVSVMESPDETYQEMDQIDSICRTVEEERVAEERLRKRALEEKQKKRKPYAPKKSMAKLQKARTPVRRKASVETVQAKQTRLREEALLVATGDSIRNYLVKALEQVVQGLRKPGGGGGGKVVSLLFEVHLSLVVCYSSVLYSV